MIGQQVGRRSQAIVCLYHTTCEGFVQCYIGDSGINWGAFFPHHERVHAEKAIFLVRGCFRKSGMFAMIQQNNPAMLV